MENEVFGSFVLDFDDTGKLLGIEILNAKGTLRQEVLDRAEDITNLEEIDR